MLKYRGSIGCTWNGAPLFARVAEAAMPESEVSTLILESSTFTDSVACSLHEPRLPSRPLKLSSHLAYLQPGDLVKISPHKGAIRTVYRTASKFNVVFATERCNSYCIMCSQPPREVQDDYLVSDYLQVIPLMHPKPKDLGISGGEPTLLKERFLDLLRACKQHLPEAALHVLTNGRSFAYFSLCEEVASIAHPDIMLGIPLYSDVASMHDFIVQAKGGFTQTVRGILNLAKLRVPTEIRIVLHAQTVRRLPQLAQFIGRNLPFVKQVAFMALEQMGFVKMNLQALWVDPADYQQELTRAVDHIRRAGIKPMIYNHQLCTLPKRLWTFNHRAISDWKNDYVESCTGCSVRAACGGFFSSSTRKVSRLVKAVELT